MAGTLPFSSCFRLLACAGVGAAILWSSLEAREILRGGPTPGTSSPAAPATGPAPAATTPAVPDATTRKLRTKDALDAVRRMQLKARDLAKGAAGPAIPVNSWKTVNGLNPSAGVAWDGAVAPAAATVNPDGSTQVTITQTQQQAVLTWETFNVGQTTALHFDQSAGGANVGQWIAFNKVGVTGSPSQILGSITAPGQVYVINPNGIIFGGASQVNAHALVASALPVNDRLIQRGLLNNPDAQFLFSALPQAGGGKGPTGAFLPTVRDENGIAPGHSTATSVRKITDVGSVMLSYADATAGQTPLVLTDDYVPTRNAQTGLVTVDLTAAGRAKVAGGKVDFYYTPAAGEFGDVIVQPGAVLTAPSNADHVGGRIALVGPNVTNAGTISTKDGQTILAAGLQVGFTPHASSDPTLRGLDVFVGKVTDGSLDDSALVGRATNAGLDAKNLGVPVAGFNTAETNPKGLNVLGQIDAPQGNVTITGRTVDQSGVITSNTSVAYNGRVDLVAGFNAVTNAEYDPNPVDASDFTQLLPFFYQSHEGNVPTAPAVENSGPINLGKDSVIQILPEVSSTDRVVGDLALPSQVNIQGQAVHFGAHSTLWAPGAAVPLNKAFGSDAAPLGAGVTVRAGAWFKPGKANYRFVQSDDSQQIYVDKNAVIDVAGSSGVLASVTEHIVAVELRGSELANSPLQRDGPLRGQTIKVDVRKHGEWDPALNDGKGGYKWVGTQLADTSGWVGLATHSAEELTVNGGSVLFKAGGPVILQSGSVVDVSGGSIAYQAGIMQTTKLTADGHVYDIAQATPDRKYDAVYTGSTSTTDPKWGTTTTTTNPLAQGTLEPGYRQGGAGGSLTLVAPVLALDGSLRGNTQADPRQQRSLSPLYNPAAPPDPAAPKAAGLPNWLLSAVNRPMPSQLSITVKREYASDIGAIEYHSYSPTPANFVFRNLATLAATNPVENFSWAGGYQFPANRKYTVELTPGIVADSGAGFGVLRIDNSHDNLGAGSPQGNITVAHGTLLTMAPAGSLSFSAGNIILEGNTQAGEQSGLQAASGNIDLRAYALSPSLAEYAGILNASESGSGSGLLRYDPKRGNITLGAGATLSTAGAVVDDRANSPTANQAPLVTAGGNVSLNANDITLKGGGTLDVSGGALLGANGKINYADAGTVTLNSGRVQGGGIGAILAGALRITGNGPTLRGFSGLGKKGGTLSVQAPAIILQPGKNGTGLATDASGTLTFDPAFFNQGGFSNFRLTGLGFALGADGNMSGSAPAMVVGPLVSIHPLVKNWEYLPGGPTLGDTLGLGAAARFNLGTSTELKDVDGKPLNNDTSLVFAKDAVMATNPGGEVALSGVTLDFLGTVTAKGGTITLTQLPSDILDRPALHLGAQSRLDAAGASVASAFIDGIHQSEVLDGGKISVSGNIVAEKGAELDVSGYSDTIMVPAAAQLGSGANLLGSILVPLVQNSNGGTITLEGQQVLFTAATLKGDAGAPGPAGSPSEAHGGNLLVSSKRASFPLENASNTNPRPTDPVLIVTAATPAFFYHGLGQPVTDGAGPQGVNYGDGLEGLGLARFGTDSLINGGFGGVSLGVAGSGTLLVQGNVTLAATRQVSLADGGVISFVPDPKAPAANPSLTVNAPYVTLGLPFQAPLAQGSSPNPFSQNLSATNGSGQLVVNAGALIDVGTLVLRNAGTVKLDATAAGTTNGSIRGNGTLEAAGDITLRAGQIYPPTAVKFSVIATDYMVDDADWTGSITVLGSGLTTPATLPLSAGGTLNLSAATIDQGGVLRAPLGTINLGTSGGSDVVSAQPLPATAKLTLLPGSVTSVSGVDPVTGKPVTVPYGINVNGDTWIDPTGTEITNVGPAAKYISLTAAQIDFQAGKTTGPSSATVDLTGGGDLYAYQFVPGTGGKNDILAAASTVGFAILPGFLDTFIPYAPYSATPDARVSLGSDPGYVFNPALASYHAGDRIHLAGGAGLPAGEYTLLPARYAALPGAYLVTPRKAAVTSGPLASVGLPDGAGVVSGYLFNGFDQASGLRTQLFGSFEVASQAVLAKRAQYDGFSGNSFFTDGATQNSRTVPRLPVDAGQLLLAARQTMALKGTIKAAAPQKTDGTALGRGGLIDISVPQDIVVAGPNTALGAMTGSLVLNAADLSNYGAESLLIGGYRTTGPKGTTVTVTTNSVLVDNGARVDANGNVILNASGSPAAPGVALSGSDVILVANRDVVVGQNAVIEQKGSLAQGADPLNILGSVTLEPGEKVGFSRGGVPISFPQGASFKATMGGTATSAAGTTQKFPAGTAVVLGAGSTFVFDSIDPVAGAMLTVDGTGKAFSMVTGDGAALRISSDPTAQITRTNVAFSAPPAAPALAGYAGLPAAPGLQILSGAKISGGTGSLILDSTNGLSLSPAGTAAVLSGQSVSFGSRAISVIFDGSSGTAGSLVLPAGTLQQLQQGGTGIKPTTALSLSSYSSIDLYGSGTLGGAGLKNLALHAAQVTNKNGGDVTMQAGNVVLDNSPGGLVLATGSAAPAGVLDIRAVDAAGRGTLTVGSTRSAAPMTLSRFGEIKLSAGSGVLFAGTGGLTALGSDTPALDHTKLTLDAPVITATAGTNQSIVAGGAVTLASSTGINRTSPQGGPGAILSIQGESINARGLVALPSGSISLVAAKGDVSVGGTLDVSGQAKKFNEVVRYTGGGQVNLRSDHGAIIVSGTVDVSAPVDIIKADGTSRLGNAGGISLSAIDATAAVNGGTNGRVVVTGSLKGLGGYVATTDTGAAPGYGGSFALDVGSVPLSSEPLHPGPSLLALNKALNLGGFTLERSVRVRQGDVVVDGNVVTHQFNLSADQGTVTVTGTIDASGNQGGTVNVAGKPADGYGNSGGAIALAAARSVVLETGAVLTVAGTDFNAAGKGGSISLEGGASSNGLAPVQTAVRDATTGAFLQPGTPVVEIKPGASLDLSVAAAAVSLKAGQVYAVTRATVPGDLLASDTGGVITKADKSRINFSAGLLPALEAGSSIALNADGKLTALADGAKGRFTGTLHLRAPRTSGSADVQVNPINGTLVDPSSIVVEGYQVYSPAGGSIDAVKATIDTNARTFASGANTNAILQNLTKNWGSGSGAVNSSISPAAGRQLHVRPGVEINGASTVAGGDLTLAANWDLATFRYGPGVDPAVAGSGEPGVLTIRAPGNLVLNAKASLSDGFGPAPTTANGGLWQALLLPAGSQSWSYRLVAGADLAAADYRRVQPLAGLKAASGSLLLGKGSTALPTATTGSNVTRAKIIPQFYQTIRTGTGDIDLVAGRDVQLLNPLLTVYTAGSAVPQPGTVYSPGDFDLPDLTVLVDQPSASTPFLPYYPAQYGLGGGNVSLQAQADIARYIQNGTTLSVASSKEMPTNWLYRRGNVGADGRFATITGTNGLITEIQSTSWWVDYSNFFADIGALGGGNLSLKAGNNVSNVNAAVPTNARMPGKDALGNAVAPDATRLLELGGGNLSVAAGGNIDGGVYYVEQGDAVLRAGGSVVTNPTRTVASGTAASVAATWLPTTFFLGKGRIDVSAGGDVKLGPVANPFWLPQGINNRAYEKTFFTTYAPTDTVTVSSLGGSITIQDRPDGSFVSSAGAGVLSWYYNAFSTLPTGAAAAQPWLRLAENGPSSVPQSALQPFPTVAGVMPGTLKATAFAGDINLVGYVTLAPAAKGTLELLAANQVNGLGVNGVAAGVGKYGSAVINLSDADPARLPGVATPISVADYSQAKITPVTILSPVDSLFAQAGGTDFSLEEKLALHGQAPGGGPLHGADFSPVRIYAAKGDISALTLFAGKPVRIMASHDVTDIALYVQNVRPTDVSLVAAGRDLVAYDPVSPARVAAGGNLLAFTPNTSGPAGGMPTDGDIQIAGPGSLEVLAGRNLILGSGGKAKNDGTAVGITSIGFENNPALAQINGAGIIAAAGTQEIYTSMAAQLGQIPGLASTSIAFTTFIDQFLDPLAAQFGKEAMRYLPVLGEQMGVLSKKNEDIWTAFGYRNAQPLSEQQAMWVLAVFQRVLRDAGRDRNDPASPNFGTYQSALKAITALFPNTPLPTAEQITAGNLQPRPAGPWVGNLSMATREIKTAEGSSIALLVPGGGITVGRATDPQKPDQGILTERGGNISIMAADSVNVGTSRIFTLRGGDEVVWSTWGNIAAGSGSKTVFSAPPTRVLIDPQSADVKNDLAGLATGSGIGVLATLTGVKPGDVDLIAPVGTIDAGDAGIRSSGNLNIAARVVLNASNIQVGGTSAGTPPPPPAPNLGSLSAASTTSAGASSAAADVAKQNTTSQPPAVLPSLITVEVLGYGGGDDEEDEEKKRAAANPAEGVTPAGP